MWPGRFPRVLRLALRGSTAQPTSSQKVQSFTQIFRCPRTIRPAINTAKMAKASIPYKPQPTPPKNNFSQHHQKHGHHTAYWRIRIMHGVYRTIGRCRRNAAQVTDVAIPNRVSLPSILPPAVPSVLLNGYAILCQLRRCLMPRCRHRLTGRPPA